MGYKRLRIYGLIDLSDDLLAQVLLRLPFKSFIQFQLVSKHWRSLISDLMCSFKKPWAFVILTPTMHYREKTIRNLEFVTTSAHNNYKKPFFKNDLAFLPKDLEQPVVEIEGSFNDLILCSTESSDGMCRTYYVYNPLTKQYIVLPAPPEESHDNTRCCLICEYNEVGEVSLRFRFRVVLATNDQRSYQYHDDDLIVEIYSSETGSWTSHILSCPSGVPCCGFVKKLVACCGQVMVWVRPDCHGTSAIIFDPFTTTSNRVIQGCSVGWPCNVFAYPFPSQDRIRLSPTLIIDGRPNPKLSVWELVMKDRDTNQNPWKLIHQVDISEMKGGATKDDNLDLWRKEMREGKAHPYGWDYRETWVANYLKSALVHPDEYPSCDVECNFEIRCVGFHPLDVNVIFLMLGFTCNANTRPQCLCTYDIRTKTINAVPEEQMLEYHSMFKLFYSMETGSCKDLYPIVAQSRPTIL